MKGNSNFKKSFRPNDVLAFSYLLVPAALLTSGLYLSVFSSTNWVWLAGQILLSFFFFQCFILLHETGHFSFFRSSVLNQISGHFFGFISFIPFSSWVGIHNLHHRWTGWRDKDPTTEGTVSPTFGKVSQTVVNVAWALSLPLFTIAYRLGNYWNPAKLKRHLPVTKLKRIYRNQVIQLCFYLVAFIFFGKFIFNYLITGYLLSLIISDVFILSQHSHIEIPLAAGQEVKPVKYIDQIPYTRSLGLNRVLAKFIFFNFNQHELHHAFPGVPAYHLNQLEATTPNQVGFWRYFRKAKKMSGMKFVFSTAKKGEDPF